MIDKLIKIQSELKAPKNQVNKFGNYKYRSCEDILGAVKPLCHKEGLCLTISDEIVDVGGRIYVKATATVKEGNQNGSISVSAWAREALEQKGMADAQLTGATSSYARKYALNGLFCIDDTKDADATNAHEDRELMGFDDIILEYGKCNTIAELEKTKKKFMKDVMACNKKEIEDLKAEYLHIKNLIETKGEKDAKNK